MSFILTLAPTAVYAQSSDLSIVSGALQTEDRKRIDAILSITRLPSAPPSPGRPAPTRGQSQHIRISPKDKDGAFTFSGLAAGIYELCATPLDSGYLDPCRWEKNGVLLNVPALQIIKGVTITLKKGSVLKVHVEDADHLIRNSPEGHLLMGVFGPKNRIYPLVRKQQTSEAKDYELSIPFDRDLKFHVRTLGISAVDESNTPIDNGKTLTVRHSSSAGPPPMPLNFRVTRKK